MVVALGICGPALGQTPLEIYDASIAADALLSPDLIPAATLTTPVVLWGTNGGAFDFGATSGDVTMEFILKGDPAASVSSFLAVGTNNPKSRLDYEVWEDSGQLGFTQDEVADYLFTPGVASPTNDTHLAFVWGSASLEMKVYVNGTLAGSTTGVDAAFVMPTGWGWLGAANDSGDEGMTGTIYRVTVYDSLLSEADILRHGKAFADLLSPPTIVSFMVSPGEIAPGQSATLSWAVKDTLKVLINGIDYTGLTNMTVSPQISTRYVLTAQNGLGATSSEIRLQVTPDLTAYDAVISADATGGHYRVESRNSLSAADKWELLQDIPALAGTTMSVTDPTPIASRTHRLYRAVLLR